MTDNRNQLYGNIEILYVAPSSVSCGAFCGCACSCGFCVNYDDKGEDPKADSSKLVAALIDSE